MDSDTPSQRRTRRQHSKAFKAQILHACYQPGASVAGIAIAHECAAWLRELFQ